MNEHSRLRAFAIAVLILAGCSLAGCGLAGCGLVSGNGGGTSEGQASSPLLARPAETATQDASPTLLPTAQVIILETGQPPQSEVPAQTLEPTAAETTSSLRQLTMGGCCVNPFWSADSRQVLYIDKPATEAPSGIWGVDLLGSEPVFVTERLGIFSPDQLLRAFPLQGQTYVQRLTDDQTWTIPNGGREVVFSRDGARVAWTTGRTQPPFDTAERQVWISSVDGSGAQSIFTGYGVGVNAWFPEDRVLVSGRLPPPESLQVLWMLVPPANGADGWSAVELARGSRLRGVSISPGGEWLAYVSTFSGDPAQDGLWLLSIRTMERRKLDLFGAYRWRDGDHLLLVPLDLSQPNHRILQIEASSGTIKQLTLPGVSPFKIANGDWSVSPDGKHVAFVSAWDGNIWLISFGS
jgi:hypothetical protein